MIQPTGILVRNHSAYHLCFATGWNLHPSPWVVFLHQYVFDKTQEQCYIQTIICWCQILIGTHRLFEISLPPKLTVTLKLCTVKEVFSSHSVFFRFDLFITWALAANGGLLELAVVVWSGASDRGVSFITVGRRPSVLMEIIMHVHNYPKAMWADPPDIPSCMHLGANFTKFGNTVAVINYARTERYSWGDASWSNAAKAVICTGFKISYQEQYFSGSPPQLARVTTVYLPH